jgi:hypothetical protein
MLAAAPSWAATPPNPKNKATVGTTQLGGQNNAQIGTTYTLGKANPINITMDSIEYTVAPVAIGTTMVLPKADEKLMILRYTLHNPNKRDFSIMWHTVKFTAVDMDDKNWEYIKSFAKAPKGEAGAVTLKPAQKASFYTVLIVPAAGEIPKLIAESGDRLVLRYQLKAKVKPLPAPIADPADKSGATALTDVPAVVGDYYPLGNYSVKLDSATLGDAPINGKAPKSGSKYLTLILAARNDSPTKQGMVWHTFTPKLMDEDGLEVKWNGTMLLASRDEPIGSRNIEPKQEVRIRHYFEVPSDLKLKTCAICERGGRRFVYDISAVQ